MGSYAPKTEPSRAAGKNHDMNEQPARTSAGAVASLVLGVVSLVFLGLLAGIPAVICGHVSLSNMNRDALLAGRGMAIAGLITGYVGIAWSLIVLACLIVMIGTASATEPFIYTLF